MDERVDIPLTSRAVFWKPRHVAPSPALIHLPLLFWLTETLAPQNVVQIGLGDGVAFMALCQALDKLGASATCHGIAVEDERLPAALAADHATHYEDFSDILTAGAGPSLAMMRAPVDLLVINTPLTVESVALCRAFVQRTMPVRGTIVLMDTDRNVTLPEGHAFLDEICGHSSCLTMQHGGNGLLIATLGAESSAGKATDKLVRLASLAESDSDFLAVRQVFLRLGQAVENLAQRQVAETGRAELSARLAELEGQLDVLQTEVKAARASEAAQVDAAATVQARLFDADTSLTALQAEAATLRQSQDTLLRQHKDMQEQIAALRASTETLDHDLAQVTAERENLRTRLETEQAKAEAERLRAQDDIGTRDERIAALVLDRDKAAATLEETTTALMAERNALKAAAAGTAEDAARIAALEAERDALAVSLEAAEKAAATGTAEDAARIAALKAERDALALSLEAAEKAAATGTAEDAARIAALEAERDALQTSLNDRVDDIAALSAHYDGKVVSERVSELEAQLGKAILREKTLEAALEESKAKATAALTALRDEMAVALERARDEGVKQATALEAALAQARAEEKALQARLKSEQGAYSRTADSLTHAQQDVLKLRDEVHILKSERDALLESTSWRITAPIRKVKKSITRS